MENNQGLLVKKAENWYNLYINNIGVGSTYKELQGYKLSITNCNKITKGYDLDELAKNHIKEKYATGLDTNHDEDIAFSSYKEGCLQMLEILGDKNFTTDDLKDAIDFARAKGEYRFTAMSTDEFIQSKQPNQWKVEILTETVNGINMHVFESPEFDEKGCIILKLID